VWAKVFRGQVKTPTMLVGLIYLVFLFATAVVAQLQLISAVDYPPSRSAPGILFDISIAFFFVVPLVIASGLVPAIVMHSCRVRSRAAYSANAIISAALAAYAFSFNYYVAENLGAILLHVPKNGRDMSDGWVYKSPPFTETIADVFREIPMIWQEWRFVGGVALIALAVSAICNGLFQSLVARPVVMSKADIGSAV
jgi:hypothetical protein